MNYNENLKNRRVMALFVLEARGADFGGLFSQDVNIVKNGRIELNFVVLASLGPGQHHWTQLASKTRHLIFGPKVAIFVDG